MLIRQAAGLDKGVAAPPGREVVGSITDAQVAEIAQIKMPDLNANDLEAAKLQVAGTARSMGITRRLTAGTRRSPPTTYRNHLARHRGRTSPGGVPDTREPIMAKQARSTPTRPSGSTASSCTPPPRRSSW